MFRRGVLLVAIYCLRSRNNPRAISSCVNQDQPCKSMNIFSLLPIGFHILLRVLVLKKSDELRTLELRSSDHQGLESRPWWPGQLICGTMSSLQAPRWGSAEMPVFSGDTSGMCTDQTSAMYDTKAAAR